VQLQTPSALFAKECLSTSFVVKKGRASRTNVAINHVYDACHRSALQICGCGTFLKTPTTRVRTPKSQHGCKCIGEYGNEPFSASAIGVLWYAKIEKIVFPGKKESLGRDA
jgi:hypothetical protein